MADIVVTKTQWQIYEFLRENGGTCTIAEATAHLGRTWGAAQSALRELQYKGVLTSERQHARINIPARFTLVPGQSVVFSEMRQTWVLQTK